MARDFDRRQEGSAIDFEEMEDYRGGKGASRKEIVLRHFSKCLSEGSKEMTVGGVHTRFVNGKVLEIAVPNQIEIFINSVEMLRIMLNDDFKKFPHIVKNIQDSYVRLKQLDTERVGRVNKVHEEFESLERKSSANYSELNNVIGNLDRQFEFQKFKEYQKILTDIASYINTMQWFEEDSFTWEPGMEGVG